MNTFKKLLSPMGKLATFILPAAILAASVLYSGCKSTSSGEAPTAARIKATAPAIRINAGATAAYTDPAGNAWQADQGFTGGRTADRGDIAIAGTQMPAIYRTEHYGMTAFSQPVPNGEYTVKLHFAETYASITEKGQRVFTVKVEDKEIKDLDVFARAGAAMKAWIETVTVTVADGKLDITFTPGVQNPEINGIEIIPR
jgi:hypothetical protein